MIIRKNIYEIIIELICLALLIGIVIYLIVSWRSIPDKIPAHYNASGEVDRMGSKGELLILPIISWIMYLSFTVIEMFPQIWNTGVKVTEENKERVYRTIKGMLMVLKLIIVANFSYLTINSSRASSLPGWYLPVFLVLIFGPIIFYIIKLFRVSK